jgi:hypothetical protein
MDHRLVMAFALVGIGASGPTTITGANVVAVSYPDFEDWRAAAKTFSGLAAFSLATATLGDDGRAGERAAACYMSANTFQLLGVTPILGRGFLPQDDRPGAPAVVMLDHSIWTASATPTRP